MAAVRHLEFFRKYFLTRWPLSRRRVLYWHKIWHEYLISLPRNIPKTKSNMAADFTSNLLPVFNFHLFSTLHGRNACAHQMLWNRAIFGDVMTFCTFSRWRPCRGDHVTSFIVILDHPRSRPGGLKLLFKFYFRVLISFRYIAILVFCHAVWL